MHHSFLLPGSPRRFPLRRSPVPSASSASTLSPEGSISTSSYLLSPSGRPGGFFFSMCCFSSPHQGRPEPPLMGLSLLTLFHEVCIGLLHATSGIAVHNIAHIRRRDTSAFARFCCPALAPVCKPLATCAISSSPTSLPSQVASPSVISIALVVLASVPDA